MLSPQDKGPIFNDMKCHCGVYSSICVFLKSWVKHFGGLETYDDYVLEILQNNAVRVAYNKFLYFLSSFYAVMHRFSVSILLMPEMPAKGNSFALNVDLN